VNATSSLKTQLDSRSHCQSDEEMKAELSDPEPREQLEQLEMAEEDESLIEMRENEHSGISLNSGSSLNI
jgi:hypothetical protein